MEKDTKELKFMKYTVCKSDFAEFETKDSVYLEINSEKGVWLNKKYVFPSQYTNYSTISIVEDWEYKVYTDKDNFETLKGKDLMQLIRLFI